MFEIWCFSHCIPACRQAKKKEREKISICVRSRETRIICIQNKRTPADPNTIQGAKMLNRARRLWAVFPPKDILYTLKYDQCARTRVRNSIMSNLQLNLSYIRTSWWGLPFTECAIGLIYFRFQVKRDLSDFHDVTMVPSQALTTIMSTLSRQLNVEHSLRFALNAIECATSSTIAHNNNNNKQHST